MCKAWESEATLYGRSYRAVVGHSSAHDERRQNRIDRELKNKHTELSKKIKTAERILVWINSSIRGIIPGKVPLGSILEDLKGGFSMVKKVFLRCAVLLLISFCSVPVSTSSASQAPELSKGQIIYVPSYSHIYIGNKERFLLLTITLSVRNIDPDHSIRINHVDYYETQGKRLKKCLDKPVILKPLESYRYIIAEKDQSGGSGANFMVEWAAETPANPPIVEAIMIGTQNQQGISFTSRGRAIVFEKK